MSGSDARVIETHADRKAEIRGIENHQISAIPFVTADGVTVTITGRASFLSLLYITDIILFGPFDLRILILIYVIFAASRLSWDLHSTRG